MSTEDINQNPSEDNEEESNASTPITTVTTREQDITTPADSDSLKDNAPNETSNDPEARSEHRAASPQEQPTTNGNHATSSPGQQTTNEYYTTSPQEQQSTNENHAILPLEQQQVTNDNHAISPPEPQTTLHENQASSSQEQGHQTAEASTTSEHENSEPQSSASSPRKPNLRVSIVENPQELALAPRRVTSGRLRMERELSRMKQSDENERLRRKARKKKEVQKAIEGVRKEREKKGVTLTPDVEASRNAIRASLKEEESMALAKDQERLRNETKALQKEIQAKYAIGEKKPHPDLVALTSDFYHGKVKDKDGIPEHVRRALTRQEIEDLRMVFDMFDAKGRGFITSNDVRRAASMLGFKAKKEVFTGMMEEMTGEANGQVTFSHFLQFVVKGQGDGDDPLDDILQCFRLLDHDQKGYITAADLRHAADNQKVPLSNRAIREMIQEADITGDSKVTSDEFVHLMLQSSTFRSAH